MKIKCKYCDKLTTSKKYGCCKVCFYKHMRNDVSRYNRRKNYRLIIQYLGGKCARCNTADNLEIDHIIPKHKSFTIGRHLGYSIDRLMVEARKCQLLCGDCHQIKTTSEKVRHGISRYRYGCRCDICKSAKSLSNSHRIRDKNGKYIGSKTNMS